MGRDAVAVAHVIVPLDGTPLSQRAVRPAVSLATRLGADVHLVCSRSATDDAACEMLDDLAQMFSGVVPVRVTVSEGAPIDAVVSLLDEASAVCMATHGRSELGRLAMGSVAEAVVQRTTAPVVLVGAQCRSWPLAGEQANVIVCSDGSAMSEAVLEVTARILERGASNAVLVEVVVPDENVAHREAEPGAHGRNHEVEAAVDRLERLRERLLATSSVDPGRVTIRAAHGAVVSRTIEHLADELHASLLVVATHGRTGLMRVAIGSTAIDIVRHAPCPVLVVRAGR
jgi:nucleotide-binding universal stress UspA family protein